MWIILFYILPIILGILTVRKFNRHGIKEGEPPVSGTVSFIFFIACIFPIINIIGLGIIWGIALTDSIKEDSDFINVKWINRLFGTKN